MEMVAPEILADARGLSVLLTLLGLVTGFVLWLFGWRSHRFWVVLTATVLGGVFGLAHASTWHTQPLVSGLLLAVSAGLLALALVRVLAFLAGGLAGLWLLRLLFPHLDQPLIVFLASSLVGLLLYRFWIMALTSLVGTLLISYSGLCLLDHYGTMDAVAWTEQGIILLNWICAMFAAIGLIFQFLLERRRRTGKSSAKGFIDLWAIIWGSDQKLAGEV